MSSIFDPRIFTWDKFLWARWVIDTRGFALEVKSPSSFPIIQDDMNGLVDDDDMKCAVMTDVAVEDEELSDFEEFSSHLEHQIDFEDQLDSAIIPNIKQVQKNRTTNPSNEMWRIEVNTADVCESGAKSEVIVVPKRITNLLPGIDMFNHHPIGHCRPPKFDPIARCVDSSIFSDSFLYLCVFLFHRCILSLLSV